MPRRALALPLAVLAGALLAPTSAVAEAAPGISDVTFSPRPLVLPSSGDYTVSARFVVTLPAADSAVESITFRLGPVQGSGVSPFSMSGRGCEAYFVCERSGQVLTVSMSIPLVDSTLRTAYRNPGSYRPVATVGILHGPTLTGSGTKVVKLRREVKCNLQVIPRYARSGSSITLHGRLSGRTNVSAKVSLWFDPAGKAGPVKVRTVRVPKNQQFYQPVVTHRGTGTWQAKYRGDAQYHACNSEPARVGTTR